MAWPRLSRVSPNTTILKVLCAYFSCKLPECLTVVLAVTDVFSQYSSPQGRDVKMVVILILQMQKCSAARLL